MQVYPIRFEIANIATPPRCDFNCRSRPNSNRFANFKGRKECSMSKSFLCNIWGNFFTPAGSKQVSHIHRCGDARKENTMSIDRMVMAFAGAMILISLLLSWVHSPYWLFFTALVGANLFQAAFTGFCPLAIILKKIGMKPGMAFK
jgi:hypothetical protein